MADPSSYCPISIRPHPGIERLRLNVRLVWCAARAVGPQDSEAVTALMGHATELGSDRRLTAHWERRLADLREDVQHAEVQQVCTGNAGVSPEEGMLLFWMGAAFYAIHKVSDVCLFLCRLRDKLPTSRGRGGLVG